jgi:hypothetical protein
MQNMLPQMKNQMDTARQAANKEPRRSEGAKKRREAGGAKCVAPKMGQTPRRMTGFSIICNKFPSLLSSLLRCFAALYLLGAHCLEEKFARLPSILTDCGTDEDKT